MRISDWSSDVCSSDLLVPSSSGAVFENINPATEEVVGVTADGTREDFLRAIEFARRAFDTTTWSTDPAFRAKCLRTLQAALQRHAAEIRPLLVAEVGTPLWLTRSSEGPRGGKKG